MKRVMLTMAWAMCLGCGAATPGAGVSMGGSSSSSSGGLGGSSGMVVGSSSSVEPGSSQAASGASAAGSSTGASASAAQSSSEVSQASSAAPSNSSGPVSSSSGGITLPGETCQTATLITAEEMIINQTTTGYVSNYDGTHSNTCWGGASPDRVYRVVVPAQQRLDVTVTPDTDFDPAVNLLAGAASVCDATPYECDTGVDSGTTGDAEHVSYVNVAALPVDVFILVEGYMGSYGRFTLQTHLAAAVEGDVCGSAPTLSSGMLMNQTTVGFSSQNAQLDTNGCKGGSAPDRVYRVEVPAGQRLTVEAIPENSLDVALNLVAGPAAACASSNHACLLATDAHAAGTSELLVHDNTTAATEELFIIVDAFLSGEGRFALNVTVGPPPAGDTCHDAETVPFPGVTNGTTLGFQDNVSAHRSCTGYSNDGPDHVYLVTLPANAHARFTLHPAGFDPSLYLLATPELMCDAVPLVCLTGSDTLNDEVVEYTNPHDAPLNVFVVVDQGFGDGGNYTLTSVSL